MLTKTQQLITQFRHSLSDIDALPQLTLLGILIGITAGVLIVAFRYAIEWTLTMTLPSHSENFEGLDHYWRFLLPLAGSGILVLMMFRLQAKQRSVSVGHVLERLHNFQGRLPLSNLIVQFIGGIISLISGQSVGREGPAVHIGASTGSLVGQWLKLPNNSLSTLLGCGVAAAISASFHTPIAAVIFAMEVVLMNYSTRGFVPVMMASVSGSMVTQATLGIDSWFTLTNTHLNSLWETPFLLLSGVVIALFASLYIQLQLHFNRFAHLPLALRLLAAGVLTGSLGLLFPEILGLGYDTINFSIESKLGLSALLGIALAKILATSFSMSMGIPGGLIGPQLVIGACVGGIMGILGQQLFPTTIGNTSIYVLLGMAAMMGAVLNAPLAALTAVVELTYNSSIIFPGMLVIAVSCLATRLLTGREGIFVEQLKFNGTQLSISPLQQLLANIGVRSAMTTAFTETTTLTTVSIAEHLLSTNPQWIVIQQEEQRLLLRSTDLAAALQAINAQVTTKAPTADTPIDLLEIPGQRYNLVAIDELASLWEAKQTLEKHTDSALFITPQIQTTLKPRILGIVTQDTMNNYY
ncbi:MAG: chloride channel protein [Cellvibrionaceae bacterium]|nr:chloride channel protein [Cellvibrionaceae bacterium]